MKYFYCLVCVLLFAFNLHGQKKEKIRIIDSLIRLSHQETITMDLVKSFEYAVEAMYLSEEIDYSQGMAMSYFFAGQALAGVGSYDKSIEYLSLSEGEKYIQTNPQLLAELYRVRGRVYGFIGFRDLSASEFKKGLKAIQKSKDESKINQYRSLAYENLSYHYLSEDELDSVWHYLNKNKEVLKMTEVPVIYTNWSNLYGLYGELYTKRQQFDSAEHYFNQAIEIAVKYNHRYLSKVYLNWGKMEEVQRNYGRALNFYFEALKNLQETGLKNEIPDVYTQIAALYEIKDMADSVPIIEAMPH